MRFPNEPHILVNGTLVHEGALHLLDYLLRSGHQVVVDEGDLVITPLDDLHDDTVYLVGQFEEDLLLLLDNQPGSVH